MKSLIRPLALLLSLPILLPTFSFAQDRIILRVSNWAGYRELAPEEPTLKEFMRVHPTPLLAPSLN